MRLDVTPGQLFTSVSSMADQCRMSSEIAGNLAFPRRPDGALFVDFLGIGGLARTKCFGTLDPPITKGISVNGQTPSIDRTCSWIVSAPSIGAAGPTNQRWHEKGYREIPRQREFRRPRASDIPGLPESSAIEVIPLNPLMLTSRVEANQNPGFRHSIPWALRMLFVDAQKLEV
jgi:hypothetical protein